MTKYEKYENADFGQAMENAVYRHAPSHSIMRCGDKVTFNGFWREGRKRNVCIWPAEGTWSDLNTDQKGGVKSFARTVFDLGVLEFMQMYGMGNREVPEFRKQYGATHQVNITPEKSSSNHFSVNYVDRIWRALENRDKTRHNYAASWLTSKRKMRSAEQLLRGGFANLYPDDLELFDDEHKSLIRQRIDLGKNLIAPIRGVDSSRVENLFLRCIDDVDQAYKSRLLTGCGGWTSENGTPRAFGHPHVIHEFPRLILCEGMADYLAVECLLDACETHIPIGVPSVSLFEKWASWLGSSKYQGQIIIVYQLDLDQNGRLKNYGAGQSATVKARKLLRENGLSAHLFDWVHLLKTVSNWKQAPKDIADVLVCTDVDVDSLSRTFQQTLNNSLGMKNG